MKTYHRLWCDGCFDLCHFGHFNFMRQARQLCDELYVGVHNDAEVELNKARPVFTLEERIELVSACKWVTKAVPDAPYTTQVDWVDRFNCDAVVHGDDIVLNADGFDTYHLIKKCNRFTTVPRTKAISTTNLIGRMIRLPKSELPEGFDLNLLKDIAGDAASLHTYIPTTHRIAQFSEKVNSKANLNGPQRGDRVVYCDGTFDLLHPGHVSFLRKAKAMGDYLVVGVHDDPTMESLMCPAMPIMTLQERVLNVLAMKYVDDVIIGAPYVITKELMDQIEPAIVVQGSAPTRTNDEDAFRVPKQLGIFRQIESDYPEMSAKQVVHRVLNNFALYANRNKAKEQSAYEVHPDEK
ncbi:cytidyltransferase-related domain containing protein [Tritrichomonas foetus]|uniref:ethanolamine-phosphate cytidylyltransferase n=1 Tax=Tritrichomonas foetus TaxID=1144522 RepID=A0A1J4JB77_9EUKA|nr:cytidyltransferase-related domain containing protein [Tritrichomonas foetus]|eukprot:OHS95929.1 cytidyltransferase-related domain containing protein [Tritrichomonas foetus]